MSHPRSDPATGPYVQLVDEILGQAIQAGASDIHFEPTDKNLLIRYRVDGLLHPARTVPLELQPNLLTRLKVMAGLLTYRVDIPQEGGFAWDNGSALDLRVSTFPTVRGERAAVRILSRSPGVRGLEQLGLSDELVGALTGDASAPQGLILVTGPAGSGKTTTLFALLNHLVQTRPGASFITLEDPIELRLDGVAQIQVAPHGELTYPKALRSLLRQDPQVLLIGEIRDAETAAIVMEASLTGHLVLSSMHSGSSVEALVRLTEAGVAPYQITSALRLLVAQRLLRARCAACGRPGEADERSMTPECRACLGTGFRGRTACAEAVPMTPALRACILDRADSARLAEAVRARPGHVTLREDALRHVRAGRTTESEVCRVLGSAAEETSRS